jgi:hypothetical protein
MPFSATALVCFDCVNAPNSSPVPSWNGLQLHRASAVLAAAVSGDDQQSKARHVGQRERRGRRAAIASTS